MAAKLISVRFEQVVQRFRVIHERPDTLREVFTQLFRHRSRYHDFAALKGISFQVAQGETIGIIGRNGSGKSTILKIIAGVYTPTAGLVEARGKVAPLIELGAGFHSDLTGRENITMNGLLLGLSRRQIREREEKIIEFAELGEFIDAPIKQYSTGMLMRLGFAVSAEIDPDILLIDEILAVGDAGFQHKCVERVERLRAAGKTILFVSHDLATVRRLCPRVLLLHNGELLADGPAEAVTARYLEILQQELPATS